MKLKMGTARKLLFCGLIAISTAFMIAIAIGYAFPFSYYSTRGPFFGFYAGMVEIGDHGPGLGSQGFVKQKRLGPHKRLRDYFRFRPGTNLYCSYIPLWGPLGLALALSGAVWWFRPQALPGTCLTCGYDLHLNTSGTCPECGTATPSSHGAPTH